MLFLALFASFAAAEEIGLSMTGSGTAQSQLTSSSLSSTRTVTVTDENLPTSTAIIEISSVSRRPSTSSSVSNTITTSPTFSGLSTASTSVDPGPITTSIICGQYGGQNCNRPPENPYWFGVTPGNPVYGFTPDGMKNPWAYYTSFLAANLTSGALESASSCGSLFTSSLNKWYATAPLSTGTVIAQSTATATYQGETYTETDETAISTITGGAYYSYIFSSYVTTVLTPAITETIIWEAETPYFYESLYTPTFTSPCCSACTIYGGNIEVMYFPPATAGLPNQTATAPSKVVNSAGFTFTSPSIYMAIQTLSARDLCGEVGSSITMATTLSFAQDDISTLPGYSMDGSLYTFYPYWEPTTFTPATFGTAPCTDVVTLTAVEDTEPVQVTYNPCFPYISIPPQVRDADPLWATCVSQWSIVLFDPPYVISSTQGGLDPFTTISSSPTAAPITSAEPVTLTSEHASPGSTTESLPAPTSLSTSSSFVVPTPSAVPSTSVSISNPADPSPTSSPPNPADPLSSVAPTDTVEPVPTSFPNDPAGPSPSVSLVDPAGPSPTISTSNPADSSPPASTVQVEPPSPSPSASSVLLDELGLALTPLHIRFF